MTLVLVTGTGTDVGKTYVTAAVIKELRAQGVKVHARKPVQSFVEGDTNTDAHVLAAASGEALHAVCPAHRWLPVPMAPPMAAAALERPAFTIADLVGELDVASTGLTFVEGAGGLRSPLASDGDTRSLVEQCNPDAIVCVGDARLGTINLLRLTADALAPRSPVVYINRFDPTDELQRRNVDWLRERDGMTVVTDASALANMWADK